MSILNRTTVALADAVLAMEANLAAVLAMAGRPGKVTARMSPYQSTASVSTVKQYDGSYASVVTFPVMPHDTRLSRDVMDRWVGYFLHEISHVLWTDDAAWRQAVGEGLGNLTNGLEDVRIERRTIDGAVAANARARLTELLSWAVGETPASFDPNDPKNLPWTFAMLGRVRVCGYDLPGVEKFDAKLSTSMRKIVDRVMIELAASQSTADVLAIARRLTAALPRPVEPLIHGDGEAEGGEAEGGEAEGGEAEGGEAEGGEAEGGEAEGGEAEGGEAEGGEAEGGEAEGGEAEGGEAEGGEAEGGETSGETSGETEAGETSGETSGETEAGETSGGLPGGPSDKAGKPGGDTERGGGDGIVKDAGEGFDSHVMESVPGLAPPLPPIDKPVRNQMGEAEIFGMLLAAARKAKQTLPLIEMRVTRLEYRERLMTAARSCARLRNQVAAALKAPANDDWRRRLSAGRVDGRAMGRLAAGDYDRPYARHTEVEGYETEIAIIMDGSTSMHSGRLFCCAVVSLAVAQAAEQVGVRCEVTKFLNDRLVMVKTPSERLASPGVMQRVYTAGVTCEGMTPLSASIAIVAERLATRSPTKRKLIFAVTDGGCDRGPDAVKAIVAMAKARGVEVIGLSIDSQTHGAFADEVCMRSEDDPTQVGLGLLARVLADRGRVA